MGVAENGASAACTNTTTPRDFTRELIVAAAKPHGRSYKDVMSRCRLRSFVLARRAAIVAVVQARPHMSYPEVGRVFGMDHTTIIHHLRAAGAWVPRIGVQRGLPTDGESIPG